MTSLFHDVQFPPDIAYGAAGGPGYSTSVVTTVAGHEKRNANWATARGRWNVAHGLKNREQVASLIAFFRARKGRAYGFRFKDWTDYQAVGEAIGTGDGTTTTFQLVKRYVSGGVAETRTITKPVAGTVGVYLDGVATGVRLERGHGDRHRHLHIGTRQRRRHYRRLRVRRARPVRHRSDGDHHRDLRARPLGPDPDRRDPHLNLR